jgi:hypothetical protein
MDEGRAAKIANIMKAIAEGTYHVTPPKSLGGSSTRSTSLEHHPIPEHEVWQRRELIGTGPAYFWFRRPRGTESLQGLVGRV